jgi:gluconokinase
VKQLRAVVVMGVAGAGKTVIGSALAAALGWRFEDGDDYHPARNKAKMAAGTPLNDDDRWPWLDVLRARLGAAVAGGEGLVLACSALKASYRTRLGEGDPALAFLFLDGDRDLIAARLAARKGHYMPPALLDSQLATLEPPRDALRVAVDAAPERVLAVALAQLQSLDATRAQALKETA